MPPRGLSNADVERLTSWPTEFAYRDLVTFFTPKVDDIRWGVVGKVEEASRGLMDTSPAEPGKSRSRRKPRLRSLTG